MGKSLMIVDDSATMRKIIMRTVRMSGLEFDRTEEAGSGVEALQKLEGGPVDVILCDINMPEMNGVELIDRIRQDETLKDLPIVVISTEGSKTRIEDLKNKGVRAYIHKPFTPELLRNVVENLLGGKNGS